MVTKDATSVKAQVTVPEIKKVRVIPKNCMLDYKIPDSYMPGY